MKFNENNPASIVFDPVPSYGGDWLFSVENLRKNAIVKNGVNLFDEFYKKTYQVPLENIFKTQRILDLRVGFISKPNENNFGRCLKYSKVDFFIELTNFLNQNIDNDNYMAIFCSQNTFKKKYNITNEELIREYPYNKEELTKK